MEDVSLILIRGNNKQTHDVVLLSHGFSRLIPILLITSKEILKYCNNSEYKTNVPVAR